MELHRVRRRLTALAALTALSSTVLQLAGTASAVEDVTSERLAGQDRFETAAAIAADAFPDGSDTVLVASGRSFPDALAGAALGLPILLTERDSLPAATAEALDDLGADEAIILGGTAAVSEAVADDVADHATVSRLAGDDRYETAADIATSLGATGVGSVDGKKTAIIATGRDFADALAGGPLATGGAGALALPILLVSTSVPAATSAALDELGITQVLILGGTAAVSSQVESDLEEETGNPAVRLAGNNRYATAVDIAEFALDTLDFPGDEALLASGIVFADALAGGPLGGVRPAPLLLTTPSTLSDESQAFFEDHSSTIETITTLGGTAAVSASTASSAETAAESPSVTRTNESITVTPTANVVQANGSTREYTATGLGTTVVDIVLVPCNNVTTTSAGETRFANSNTNSVADRASDGDPADGQDVADTPAAITEVNGETLPAEDPLRNNDYVPDVSPDNGSVTFEVSGPSGSSAASSCVIPVVLVDENIDDALNVPATHPADPSEEFGTGGSVTFSPSAQGAGQFSARNVQYVNKASDFFVACSFISSSPEVPNERDGCREFRYDANDTFQVSSTPITMAEFESRLSPDDDVSGTYADVAASRSVFNLNDEAPTAPTEVAAESVTSSGATITWLESSTETVDSYRVYRRSATSSTCPASTTGSTLLTTPDIPDANPDLYVPAEQYSYTDTTASQASSYCYNVVAVDELDEGTPSEGVAVTTTGTSGQPTITSVTGTSTDGVLSQGDVHLFTFSEPMSVATSSATYDVRDSDSPSPATGEITCGDNATCTWTSSTTLRVEITTTPALTDGLTFIGSDADLDYPLTITATTFTDAGGAAVDLNRSDTQIERT